MNIQSVSSARMQATQNTSAANSAKKAESSKPESASPESAQKIMEEARKAKEQDPIQQRMQRQIQGLDIQA